MQRTHKILSALLLALIAVTGILLYVSSTVFLQLFIALALAYILNPAVEFLQTRGLPRTPAILTVFSIALLSGLAVTVFMISSISGELSKMQINLPGYAQHLYDITPPAAKSYLGIETPEKLSFRMAGLLEQARTAFPDIVTPLLGIVKKAFSSTIGFVLGLLGYLIIPVYLFYLLVDLPSLKSFLESFIPERFQNSYRMKLAEIDVVLSGFIRGQVLVCAILAVLYSAGLWMIGIDLAIAIGTLAGITFIIPYVGTILGIVLSMAMALLKFHDVLHPLLCLGWFALVQGLEGMVITPKVVGDTVGLHPLVAIVALLIGGQIFGLFGMLVAVPLTAVLQVFLRSLAAWYRETEFYRGI